MILYKGGKYVDFSRNNEPGARGNGWINPPYGLEGNRELEAADKVDEGKYQVELESSKTEFEVPAEPEDLIPQKPGFKAIDRLNAKKTIALIKHLDGVLAVENVQDEELASEQPRKMVLDAINKKINELEAE